MNTILFQNYHTKIDVKKRLEIYLFFEQSIFLVGHRYVKAFATTDFFHYVHHHLVVVYHIVCIVLFARADYTLMLLIIVSYETRRELRNA